MSKIVGAEDGEQPAGRRLASLRWKFNRLRVMGLREVVWRAGRSLHAMIEHFGFGLVRQVPASSDAGGMPWLADLPKGFDAVAYLNAADRITSGRFDIFSLRNVSLGFPPNWNRDPLTGTEAPMSFGKTLDYRSKALVGNIKYLWEPNRHLELVTLAQAFHLSSDARYALSCRMLLESWLGQCPYPLGPNWTSSLEHAVRLVNWSFVWHLLGGENSSLFQGEAGGKFRHNWLASIYRHLHFVRGHFSRHSSANNHLLGEYMGLFIGAGTWPLWRECAQWRDLAREGLERETINQNSADGVNREQATWYHHEVVDMMLLCGFVGRANGVEFSPDYWGRLVAMLEYIASVMDVAGHVPMIGDSDDAVMVRFSQEAGFNAYRSLLATGAVLFNRGDFKAKAGHFDNKSRWLLGDAAARQFEELPMNGKTLPVQRAFPEGGYYILGDKFETEEEIRIVADAGPLGYLSIAAHGHADALAFTLSVGGVEMLVDPGTYAYHTQKQWRDYFRGTSAHNTVRVDGQDQSVAGGNFLWLRHAHARCESFVTNPERDEWQASHDGYLRLTDPVLHRRKIALDKQRRHIEVTDWLEGKGRHKVELFWHFSEECEVSREGGSVIARNGRIVLTFSVPENLLVRIERGRENPPLGWVSRRFDEKTATTTAVWEGTVEVGSSICTSIRADRSLV